LQRRLVDVNRFSNGPDSGPIPEEDEEARAARATWLGDRFLQANDRIKGLARRSFSKQVLSEIGGPAGLYALDAERYPDPVLVASTCCIGPKLEFAAQLGLHGTVGADLVNHCVNDIAVQGATPLYFQDYLAAGRLEPAVVEQVVSGLVDGCKANGCALLGGDTAERPGLLREHAYELAGFLTGVVSRPRLLLPEHIVDGDLMLALPANGLHNTGFDRAHRFLFEIGGYHTDQYVNALGDKVGAALLRPHRSYLSPIRKLLQAGCAHGFAHITSGGVTESLPRALPRGLAAQVDAGSWDEPMLFHHLRELTGMERDEMLRIFNMGVGLVVFVRPPLLGQARNVMQRINERFWVLGRVVRSPQRKVMYL
jgi:phosphoribosylformylglycinamidine cyclo-ligase